MPYFLNIKFCILLLQTGIFEKEYLLYGVILPILSRERENKGLKKLPIPRCFYAHPDPGVLVMINLKEMGFDLLKNQAKGLSKGLEGEEIQLYLKSLASFHASTHHMIQIEGC